MLWLLKGPFQEDGSFKHPTRMFGFGYGSIHNYTLKSCQSRALLSKMTWLQNLRYNSSVKRTRNK